jgi:uncharacterized surface protein with fasciclin (FAS1) repeats
MIFQETVRKHRFALAALATAALLTVSAGAPAIANCSDKDIVETAVAAGSFQTLVAGLEAADLVDTLKGDGPFTVFAPTDEAFAKLPEGTVEALLRDIPKLRAILTYHVVPGEVSSADVVKIKKAETVNGQSLTVKVNGKSVMIDYAKVVKTDIHTSNGIIHVIDTVVLPKERITKR